MRFILVQYRPLILPTKQASGAGIVGIVGVRDRHEGFRATLRKRVSKAKGDLRCETASCSTLLLKDLPSHHMRC
jgi:hypothetical protein